jgi:hypothetical protein
MMKILDSTTQKFIHLHATESGLDNITLLNTDDRNSK